MDLNLSGKTAVVCGSTQGIGLETARELALLGANVTLFARNEEKLKTIIPALSATKGQTHRYIVADFSNPQLVRAQIGTYLVDFPVVHILVNNTGGPKGGPLIDADHIEMEAAFSQHLLCNQILAQACVPAMKKAGFGRIVNIISISVKQPIEGLGVSNTIRWAVAGWAKTLATELGQFGITVNNVLPGYTSTGRLQELNEKRAEASHTTIEEVEKQLLSQVPIGRFAKSKEVAAAVAFLCSPAASAINGINLPVDGGLSKSL